MPTTPRPANPFFRRRYGYTSTTPRVPKSSTTAPDAIRNVEVESGRSSDQELEPSLVDKKFSQNNQIDIGTEIINQGLGEAITSISRAPLPYVSTTVRHVKITTPGTIRFNDEYDYQISKRADSISSGS